MQAVQITAPKRAVVVEAPMPSVLPGDVLIGVHAAGICGTDLHIYDGEYEARYPLIPGHEFSGEIVSLGADVARFSVGDRVTADPNIACNRCVACQRNEQNQCQQHVAVGVTRDGGFAQFVAVPEGVVFAIGDLSYAAAAMVEPLACVIWGLKRVEVQPGDTVLVQGAGPMGCLMLQAVRRAGASFVVVTDTVSWRLDLANQLGADATALPDELVGNSFRGEAPDGFDVVVDVTGIPAVVEASLAHVRPRGKLWLFGVCPPGATVQLSPYEIFRKDLTIFGSFALSKTFSESLALIRNDAIRVEPLISHRLPLVDFAQALHTAQHDPQRMKVQLTI